MQSYDVEVPNHLVEAMVKAVMHGTLTGEISLRSDVLTWLSEHTTHPVRIRTWANAAVDGVTMTLCFDDLSEATHFKLRWF